MSGTLRDFIAIAMAFVGTWVLLRALVPVALRIGLVDRPNELKIHGRATPLIGGLAIFAAFAIAIPLLGVGLTEFRPMLMACAILVIVGVLDDFVDLSPAIRFGAQIFAALIMCLWGDVQLIDMGLLKFDGSVTTLGLLSIPLTVFCVVGVVNAVNMVDGLDGLSSGLVLIALAAMGIEVFLSAHQTDGWVISVLFAAVLAFWFTNTRWSGRDGALSFLGDAGSLFLGFALAWFVVRLTQGDERAFQPVQALWFLLIPLSDTVRLLIWRTAMGNSPFQGDQEHLHHVLRRLRLRHGLTVYLILALALAGAAFGILAPRLGMSELTLFMCFMAWFVVYSLALGVAWWRQSLFGISLDRRVAVEQRRVTMERRQGDRRRGGERRRPVDPGSAESED